jgi:hypothetical protein
MAVLLAHGTPPDATRPNVKPIKTMKTYIAVFTILVTLGGCSKPKTVKPLEFPTTCVNLKKFHNASLDKTWHPKTNVSGEDDNDLAALGKGRKVLAGTEFELSGLIQLLGKNARGWGGKFPESVTGIPVDVPVKTLQFLHGCGWQAPDGTKIGKYVVHFQDNSTLDIPIVYGVDVRDWWYWTKEPKGTDQSVIAWTGENAATKAAGMSLRIYKSTWTNPDPIKRVVSLDFVSSMGGPAPFLIAITAN